jgi:Flp pilus assembly protein CpaB
MVDTTSRPATADPTGAAPTGARQIRRRRSLPGSRAVVGGLLVAAAAVGAFGTYAAASDGPSDSVVVLTRDVGPGERLDAEDLAVVAAELPLAQRATVVDDLAAATGAVAISPLSEGQLLATSDVVKLAGVSGRGQLSIPVDPARANNGQLTPGELVDVIATATSASSTSTRTIAGDAVVVRVFTEDLALGSTSSVVVTLSLAAEELEPVADAAAGATISLARVSGIERRPPGAAAGEVAPAERASDGGGAARSADGGPSGIPPTGNGSSGTDPGTSGAEPSGADPASSGPTGTVPADAGATGTEPSGADPAGSGPTGDQPGGSPVATGG